MIIVFGADMSSCEHIGKTNDDICIFSEGVKQGFNEGNMTCNKSTLYWKPLYFLLVNATEIYQFKAKDFEIKYYTLCKKL